MCDVVDLGLGWSEHDEDAVSLVYKKWNFTEQNSYLDMALIGWFYV